LVIGSAVQVMIAENSITLADCLLGALQITHCEHRSRGSPTVTWSDTNRDRRVSLVFTYRKETSLPIGQLTVPPDSESHLHDNPSSERMQ